MWIKICGNTRLDDCLLAAELGADAIGFVFAGGKRTVTADQVAAITAQLPHSVEKIGVFTTSDYQSIVTTVEQAGLTGVQLHGKVNFNLSERLRLYFGATERCAVIQVLHWWTDRTAPEQQEGFAAEVRSVTEEGSADAILVDSRTAAASGGTGTAFDWSAAKGAVVQASCRMIVAGGLVPENVAQAIEVLRPWGVDVASGVERSPGRKDPEKLARFIAQARSAVNATPR